MKLILPDHVSMGDVKLFAERLGMELKHNGFNTMELRESEPHSVSNVRSLSRPTPNNDDRPTAA